MVQEEYIAKTLFGLEETLAQELVALGAKEVTPLKRAVRFHADMPTIVTAHLALRTALTILKPIYQFEAFNENSLYEGMKSFKWNTLLDNKQTFAIQAVVNSSLFNHSKYVALKCKDAIVDQFREATGARPSIDTEQPYLPLEVNIYENRVSVLQNFTGTHLYKRGYRTAAVQAPINEVLAAGMIALTEWDGSTPFYDGMCGSGTLLIEAAMKAANIAPNLNRSDFAFTRWPDFDRKLIDHSFELLKSQERKDIPPIIGSDLANSAVMATNENIAQAGLTGKIEVERCPFSRLKPRSEHTSGVLVTNPPYGERLKVDELVDFYRGMGDTMKKSFAGFDAWIISSDIDSLKQLGLKPSRRIALFNGPLECKFLKYNLYDGSKKHKNNHESGVE